MDIEQQSLREATDLTQEQYQNFLNEVEKIPSQRSMIDGKTARLMFEFMEDTGLRVNEAIHVRRKDVDFRTRILTVVEPKISKTCKCSKWKNRDEYSRVRIMISTDPNCIKCHGKGRWKKPQITTFTHRIKTDLYAYCQELKPEDLLFPISRISVWKWGKKAGINSGLRIFQQKEERLIEGIFPHLFRALCSLRMTRDSKDDPYQIQLVARKLRHSFRIVTERYTKMDINYLLRWEEKTYNKEPQKLYNYKEPKIINGKIIHWQKKTAEVPTLCEACNSMINPGEIILNHHISYFPEKTCFVHSKCHREIHRTDSAYKRLQPNPFQVYRYYNKKGNYYNYEDTILDIDWHFKDYLEYVNRI